MEKVKVGLIGCGSISSAYLTMAKNFKVLDIHAAADIDPEKAAARASEFGIPKVCSVDELLRDPAIEIVLNLTVPKAHAPVSMRTLEAGKHVFVEKPLAITREEGVALLGAAKKKNVRIGAAPDTFMGAGIQTARKLIDDGKIGRPVAFTCFMMCRGHETWHPSPEFYYEAGGGPMFDMGPYYLTALLNLLGPVSRITGAASIAISDRTITSQLKFGKKIPVQTPDHVCGTIEFTGGAIGTIMTSFAVMHSPHPCFTIFGTDGTIEVPDPNGFDGTVKMRRADDKEWKTIDHTFLKGYGRAVGLADMATAIRAKRPHRCSAEQAFTVLDLMQGFLDSERTGQSHCPSIAYERPPLMPANLPFGELDR